MNRLSNESSPYLIMHAENPVDWYPWSNEAFKLARDEDKPIFLSIGYSSCHWCHVIAHESFEDEAVAEILNRDYISIKVDKEERPDVDAVYMDALQLSTGSGGWPMTILLTPDAEPFFTATYVPKKQLKDLLTRAASLWRQDRAEILRSAASLTKELRRLCSRTLSPAEPDAQLLRNAADSYSRSYDRQWGGFGNAPKFPSAHDLLFLLAYHEQTGDSKALSMVEGTLTAMYRGGMFDHIGGGFCRYSVDRKWLVPHFEKMLYDNALLLWAYSEAWRITQAPLYRTAAIRTAEYVSGQLAGPEGGFCCSEDADSEGAEGAFYLFARDELLQLLGDDVGALFCDRYGITAKGNFEGLNIPNLIDNDRFADEAPDIPELRSRVLRYRAERMALARDDKVLTSWNALMITALCRASAAFGSDAYLASAKCAERFIAMRLTRADGDLYLSFRNGHAKGDGVLQDYAFYAMALLELHSATGDEAYLKRAESLADAMLARFHDGRHGGFYLYAGDSEQLITRPKEFWDPAVPSGNSAAALVFSELAERTGADRFKTVSKQQLRLIAGAAAEQPRGHGFGLYAIARSMTADRKAAKV